MQGSERSDMTSVAIVGWSVFSILKRELLEKRKNSEWLQPALLKILKLIPETNLNTDPTHMIYILFFLLIHFL